MDTYSFSRNRGKWQFKKTGYFEAIRSGDSREEVYTQTISYMRIHGGILKIHNMDGELIEELTFTKRNAPPQSM